MDPGDETPIGYGNPINTTQEIYSGAKLHPVQGKQLHFITGDQINAILKVNSNHFVLFMPGFSYQHHFLLLLLFINPPTTSMDA